MNVLVLNAGSSTLKFQLISTDPERIEADDDERLARGVIERIGGEAIIKARGASSAASAASAAIDHIRSWALDTPANDWVSMAVPSTGAYGIEPGIIYSVPCTCANGDYTIVEGLEIDEFSRGKMNATETELREERAAVEHLL